MDLDHTLFRRRAFQVELVVKNLPANAGDARDVGSIPGSERSPREANGTPLQSHRQRSLGGGGGGYSPWGGEELDTTEHYTVQKKG